MHACRSTLEDPTDALGELHARLGGGDVAFADLWLRSQRLFHGTKDRPIDTVTSELRAKWTRLLVPEGAGRRVSHTTAELAPKVAEAFPAPGPGWNAAREHAPDVMIVARDVDAIARGEASFVLGEIHVALNTLDVVDFLEQHPAPQEIVDAVRSDVPERRVLILRTKNSSQASCVRLGYATVGPEDCELETGYEGSALPRDRVLQMSALVVRKTDAGLVVRRASDALELPLVEVIAHLLSDTVVNSFDLLEEMQHAPRITIDSLVVRRESWRFEASELTFAADASDAAGHLATLRWARKHGLPRFVFFRSPLEVKPMFVDLESPIAVRILRRVARLAQEHPGKPPVLSFTEMLPDLEHLWVTDAAGERYTSEVRLIAVDRRR